MTDIEGFWVEPGLTPLEQRAKDMYMATRVIEVNLERVKKQEDFLVWAGTIGSCFQSLCWRCYCFTDHVARARALVSCRAACPLAPRSACVAVAS